MRHGYPCPPVVIGATITVRRCSLSSSGDTTRQGRVLRTSLPTVGSSLTRCTSPRLTGPRLTDTATLYYRTRLTSAHPTAGPHHGRAWPWPLPPNRPAPHGRGGRSSAHAPPAARLRLAAPPAPTTPWARGCPWNFRFG